MVGEVGLSVIISLAAPGLFCGFQFSADRDQHLTCVLVNVVVEGRDELENGAKRYEDLSSLVGEKAARGCFAVIYVIFLFFYKFIRNRHGYLSS
jgi:hypothetical protein